MAEIVEVKVLVKDIDKLKTATEVKEDKDSEGNVIQRRVVTKFSFEAEIDPAVLADIHRLLYAEAPVHVCIGSPQAVMDVLEKAGAFAERT